MDKLINVKDKINGRIERISMIQFEDPDNFNHASKTQLRRQRKDDAKKVRQLVRINSRKKKLADFKANAKKKSITSK